MKKLLYAVAVAGAVGCHSTPPNTRTSSAMTLGASSPRAAVNQFLDAAHAGDLQAMSFIWGTMKGPSSATIERTELEKRTVILQCYFNADSHQIVSETTSGDGRRTFRVTLTRGEKSRTTTVYTVEGPGERWYVENLDIAAVRDFCGSGAKR